MRNLLLDDLPHDVRVVFGNRKPSRWSRTSAANSRRLLYRVSRLAAT